jgi:hypothetical protein
VIWFDWQMALWPALQAWFSGNDPYSVSIFLSPPWLLPLIAPFGLLPPAWGAVAMDLVALSGLIALSIRLRKPWVALMVGVSSIFMYVILDANVDGYVLWGLALGGPVGLLLLSVKPQVAILVAVIWSIQAWQKSRWRGVLKLMLPTAIIGGLFTILYPQWIGAALGANRLPRATTVNLWPWLLPVAGGLMIVAVAKLKQEWAALATNLAMPYFQLHSYIGALALIAAEIPWLGGVAVIGSWVYFFVAYVGILRR